MKLSSDAIQRLRLRSGEMLVVVPSNAKTNEIGDVYRLIKTALPNVEKLTVTSGKITTMAPTA